LVDRELPGPPEAWSSRIRGLPRIPVSPDAELELGNLASGAFSPLIGFMGRTEVEAVVSASCLPSGLPWTIPILLDVPRGCLRRLRGRDRVLLVRENEEPLALFEVHEVAEWNRRDVAAGTFGTVDERHPGVARMLGRAPYLAAGPIQYLGSVPATRYGCPATPRATRRLIGLRGWRHTAGFQTRNVPHRAHEYLQRVALEVCDGLLIHPTVGWKQDGDFRPEIVLGAYAVLLRHYLPADRVILGALPTPMRYAGPREAAFHALVRKNYGCTHFIVGRDHAGVGRFYDVYAAHRFLERLPDLGIRILTLSGPFHCPRCGGPATARTCPHADAQRVEISGTDIRRRLAAGLPLPGALMRDEVAAFLRESEPHDTLLRSA
jgi:sulfate adenylyltransferase